MSLDQSDPPPSRYVQPDDVTLLFSKITAKLRSQRTAILMRIRNEDVSIGTHLSTDTTRDGAENATLG